MTDEALPGRAAPYGPSTSQIRRFLQRLVALTAEVEAQVASEYALARATLEFQAAERLLGVAIARSGREAERDALGGPLLRMLAADVPSNSPPAVGGVDTPPSSPPVSGGEPALRPIAEPALAATLALMMQDVLTENQVALLYAPFQRFIPRTTLF